MRSSIYPKSEELTARANAEPSKLKMLNELERKVLWLASWMIHNANHLRPKRDGLKVGGHQASSASMVSIMTALYFDVLRPQDRVAVKPHASPVFHAIQYLFGRQTRERLENFRALGGAQSYPSRTKDTDDVDFSTGSEGLGAAITLFASLVQDYIGAKQLSTSKLPSGRMIALLGDAELDEGNLYEALLEGWKHRLRNVWWIIDYNRQSLDRVIEDRTSRHVEEILRALNWNVITLKYGNQLRREFACEGGQVLREWIDNCPNSVYSALIYKGGAAWRERLDQDLGRDRVVGSILRQCDDAGLARLMSNLAGHDMESLLEAFHGVKDDTPTCFLVYTIKGFGLPFAGHKDNHSALMTIEQMETFKQLCGVKDGEEWEPFAGLGVPAEELLDFIKSRPFAEDTPRRFDPPRVAVPEITTATRGEISTQEAFGRILNDLARGKDEFARAVVTTSPDVTVSTNLGGWVNRRGVFDRSSTSDEFRAPGMNSLQQWVVSPEGQHIELGIAENNLFLMLATLGLSSSIFDARLLPVGTVYDTFINRGLDALIYGCYQNARYLLAGTPSGISLAPEGGAHQSAITPLIGIGQPGLTYFEPSYVDELCLMMRWGFEHIQHSDGGSVYLRLSTRRLKQPERKLTEDMAAGIINGGYWLVPPTAGTKLAIICTGVSAPDALAAHAEILPDVAGCGLLAVTSPDRLYSGWLKGLQSGYRGPRSMSHADNLLSDLSPSAFLVTVCDAHPLTLSWMGSIRGHRVFSLGVDHFGQSGDIPALYAEYRIDSDAIVDSVARAFLSSAEATDISKQC